MKSKRNTTAVGLLVLFVATVYGLYATSRPRGTPVPTNQPGFAPSDSAPGTDQSSLVTVQALLRLPTTTEERGVAQVALRLADEEMDLAFAAAVRRKTLHPRAPTPEQATLAARLTALQARTTVQQERIDQLTAAITKAAPAARAGLEDQLALAKAQLELTGDESDDVHQDLMRIGGDPQGQIQAMTEAHQAASKSSDSTRIVVTATPVQSGLVRHAGAWWALEQKVNMLRAAQRAADSLATAFTKRHAALEAAAATSVASRAAAGPGGLTHDSAAALVRTTRARAADEQNRSTLDRRIDDQHQLSAAFGEWGGIVANQQWDEVNHMLRGVAVIIVICLLGLFFDRWLERVLARVAPDRRSRQTMDTLVRVSLQVMGVLLALLVIFGEPGNLGTFLGLAGAGLTVALKDFIVAFVGWFVLMGRNGIRIGDIVEINGVTGEVAELGVFYTVLHETGDWSGAGDPTGRRVAFMNGFAIEGHYFNFSTSGQWLWEEVQIVVPAGRDPYPIIEALQHEAEEATADHAAQAEAEWRRSTRSPSLSAVTAAPAISVRPVIGGVELTIRYITHAGERHQLRSRLYQTAVDLLGEPRRA